MAEEYTCSCCKVKMAKVKRAPRPMHPVVGVGMQKQTTVFLCPYCDGDSLVLRKKLEAKLQAQE